MALVTTCTETERLQRLRETVRRSNQEALHAEH